MAIPPPGPGKVFRGESDDKKTIESLGAFRGHLGEATINVPLDDQGTPRRPEYVSWGCHPKQPALLVRKDGKIGNEGLGEVGHARDLERRPNPRENT